MNTITLTHRVNLITEPQGMDDLPRWCFVKLESVYQYEHTHVNSQDKPGSKRTRVVRTGDVPGRETNDDATTHHTTDGASAGGPARFRVADARDRDEVVTVTRRQAVGLGAARVA